MKNNCKARYINRWAIPASIIIFTFLANITAGLFPVFVENVYSRYISRYSMGILSMVTGIAPFSVAEIVIVCIILSVVAFIACVIIKVIKKKELTGFLKNAAYITALVVSIMYFIYTSFWSINYHRMSIAASAGLDVNSATFSDLVSLAKHTVKKAALIRNEMSENSDGIAVLKYSISDTLANACEGFKLSPIPLNMFGISWVRPKKVVLSKLMSVFGIEGFFFPYTGEPNINTDIPSFMIPFAACHETAHLLGYAREEEANYIAFIACRNNPDTDYRYSGRLNELIYILNAIYEIDEEKWSEIRGNLPPPMHRDLVSINNYWVSYDSVLQDVSEAVNDVYLRSNFQTEGIYSYGLVVDLLLAEYISNRGD